MKPFLLAAALATALPLAACNTPQQRVGGGALIGGATGAVIGGAATGRAGGALASAAIGAVAGGAIGAATSPRCARVGYDRYGNQVCVRYYRQSRYYR